MGKRPSPLQQCFFKARKFAEKRVFQQLSALLQNFPAICFNYFPLEKVFQHIICTETEGRNPMCADILGSNFSLGHSIEIIKDSQTAIRKGIEGLSADGGMAILGTHCLGPAVKALFKISFDSL